MSKKFKTLTGFILIGLTALLIVAQVLAQSEPAPTTIAEAIARAEKDQQAAQLVLTELNQALTAARAAGDTQAVQTLTSAIQQAEVRVAQVVQQVEQVRRAPTLAAATAQLDNANRALARVTDVIQALPPAVTQKYVTTIATTVVPTTVTGTTTETTAATTSDTTAATTVAATTVVPTTVPQTTTTVFTTITSSTSSTVRSQ